MSGLRTDPSQNRSSATAPVLAVSGNDGGRRKLSVGYRPSFGHLAVTTLLPRAVVKSLPFSLRHRWRQVSVSGVLMIAGVLVPVARVHTNQIEIERAHSSLRLDGVGKLP